MQGTPAPPVSQRAMRRRPADYLEALNAEQRDAVESLEGPLLVLAGAGTGKTRVLTTRIGHILSQGRARPGQILAVTFTNKAAREMKARVGELIGGVVEGMPWLGTFHAIGVKILRRHAELVELKPSFTVLDTDDQIRLIKQLLQAENIDEKRWPARLLASMIDGWKNRGLRPDRVPDGESFGFGNGKGRDLYALYQRRLKELNAADFGDLLLENLRLFQDHADVLAQYQERFRFMLVDEYQDTNVAQYLWLRLLAQGTNNICCVGDDDQSIYGWRGAEVDNILRFESDFPGAKVIRLERNYRSTGHILAAASGLIAHNQGRLGKTLHTDGDEGEKVVVEGCWDDEEEARVIGEDIEQLQRDGHTLNEFAVLVRASFQMRAFEDRFITLGLDYRVIGGPRFYERQEIRDATAYFEVTLNPANDLKFERIVNTPRRGLGEATMKALHQLARANGVPLMQAARLIVETEELKPKPRKALADLIAAFDRWRSLVDTMSHTELAELILDESGYTGMWQADRSQQAQGRLGEPQRADPLHGGVRYAGRLHGARLAGDGRGDRRRHRPGQLDDLALGQGAGVRHGVLAGLGRRVFCPISAASTRRGAPASRKNADSLMWDSRGRGSAPRSRSRKTAAITACGRRRCPRASSTNCRWTMSKSPRTRACMATGRAASKTPGLCSPRASTRRQAGNAHKANRERGGGARAREPITIEGTLVAASTVQGSGVGIGERVFHQKFGYGRVAAIDGNKLTVDFEKAGRKKVVDSFVERV